MFTDEIEITFKAGDGVPGRVSFFPGKHSGPDGANGGYGGNLLIKASRLITNLNNFTGKHMISAENGTAGGRNNSAGGKGVDLEINLPIGSFLFNQDSKEEVELSKDGERVLLCIGGKGGKGNAEFKSSSNTTPMYAQKGLSGQKKHFKIIVRMIADFGLIGLPNAGKSSLLNELTNASVKVASYPFTTLEPNLGVFKGKVIADIPGLIEGAHSGKGLGVKFLKHIEKVKLLIHCISCESEDVVHDYKTIIKELTEFNPELGEKKQIILLTKSDLSDDKELNKKLKQLKKLQEIVLPVSILDSESLDKLKSLFF